jgi:hypothetical protein
MFPRNRIVLPTMSSQVTTPEKTPHRAKGTKWIVVVTVINTRTVHYVTYLLSSCLHTRSHAAGFTLENGEW